MDIKQLKFLVALDETRHFGQAAVRCHVTQPTLSMRLRSLEEELDLPLVNRGQRFEGFTAPGERVLAWARTVLAAYDGLYAEAAACRGNLVGTLRLGVVPLSSFDPLPLLQRLHREHPNLRFELSALSSEQILEQLANNRLDIGVSYLERLDSERFESLSFSEARMGLLYDQRFFTFVHVALLHSTKTESCLPFGFCGQCILHIIIDCFQVKEQFRHRRIFSISKFFPQIILITQVDFQP